MVNLNLPDNSKIMPGKTHGKDGPNKIVFNIYRWNREENKNPRVDKYFVDKKLGPMTLDALMFIKNESTQPLPSEDLVEKEYVAHAL